MTILNIGAQAYNSSDVAARIRAEIQILETRLQQLLPQQLDTSPVLLQAFSDLLEARRALLSWLTRPPAGTVEYGQL